MSKISSKQRIFTKRKKYLSIGIFVSMILLVIWLSSSFSNFKKLTTKKLEHDDPAFIDLFGYWATMKINDDISIKVPFQSIPPTRTNKFGSEIKGFSIIEDSKESTHSGYFSNQVVLKDLAEGLFESPYYKYIDKYADNDKNPRDNRNIAHSNRISLTGSLILSKVIYPKSPDLESLFEYINSTNYEEYCKNKYYILEKGIKNYLDTNNPNLKIAQFSADVCAKPGEGYPGPIAVYYAYFDGNIYTFTGIHEPVIFPVLEKIMISIKH